MPASRPIRSGRRHCDRPAQVARHLSRCAALTIPRNPLRSEKYSMAPNMAAHAPKDLVTRDYAIKVEIITRQIFKHRAPDARRPRLGLKSSGGLANRNVHVDGGGAGMLARGDDG